MRTNTATTTPASNQEDERLLVVSSDGHVRAEMAEYRPYLPVRLHEEFDTFVKLFETAAVLPEDPKSLLGRTDKVLVDDWLKNVVEAGRVQGVHNPNERIFEMDRDGRAAEVLFPDFGLPFQLGVPKSEAKLGYRRNRDQVAAGIQAYNRWLVDFCSVAPERFAAMAVVDFEDVDAAVNEIVRAHESGLRGVLLPEFENEFPPFHPRYEPIWNVVEELGMPLNSHTAFSSVTRRPPCIDMDPAVTNMETMSSISIPQYLFFAQQILPHFILGGVLERHPGIKLVLTEMGSGWIVGALEQMDYSFEGSYLRRDVRNVIPDKPSEYFARQCYLGSSIFSRAEIERRHDIGIDKMMLGMDYPHHEGTWGVGPGTVSYLQATLGAARIREDEARRLLGETAVSVWGLDVEALRPIVNRIGPRPKEVLTPPTTDFYPRGDVNKPSGVLPTY